jgi:hypothetical protein
MADHVYKTIELVGSSTRGIDDAIQQAIRRVGFKWWRHGGRWRTTTWVTGRSPSASASPWSSRNARAAGWGRGTARLQQCVPVTWAAAGLAVPGAIGAAFTMERSVSWLGGGAC